MTLNPQTDSERLPAPSSGEGAASALKALIRKRPPPPAFRDSDLPGKGDVPPQSE